MLRSAVEACLDELWDERAHGTPFCHLAYHALFYTDFYLSDDANTFQPRDFHLDKATFLPGDYPQFGGVVTTPEKAFTRTQLLEYADHCLRIPVSCSCCSAVTRVSALTGWEPGTISRLFRRGNACGPERIVANSEEITVVIASVLQSFPARA